MRVIYIQYDNIMLLEHFVNKRLIQKNGLNFFYKALFIVIKNDLDYLDCQLQLSYIRKMILLNLFYQHQIENFITVCKSIDLVIML